MKDEKRYFMLAGAAVCLLALTFGYMLFRHIPLGRMPSLVWVLFGFAIAFPIFKAIRAGRNK